MSAAAALLAWTVIVIVSMVVVSYLARRWGRSHSLISCPCTHVTD